MTAATLVGAAAVETSVGSGSGTTLRVGHLTSASDLAHAGQLQTTTAVGISTTLAPMAPAAAAPSSAPLRPAPPAATSATTAGPRPKDATPPPTTTAPAGGHTITGLGLWVMARDGSGLRRLLPSAPQAAAWAPGDARLAVGRNNGVDEIDASTGAASTLVTFPGTVLISSLAWSPDGQRVAVVVVHNPTTIGATTSEAFVVNATTGSATSLGRVGATAPQWSSRGCLGWVYSTVNIFCPGAAPVSLPPLPGSDQFSWSPDGSRYAITSSSDATAGAIVTYRADGSDPVAEGDSHVFRLSYLGDGRNLAFQTLDNPNPLWVQPVAGGPPRNVGTFATYALNRVDDGIVAVSSVAGGYRSLLSITATDTTPRPLATIDTAAASVTGLVWSANGRAIAAFATNAG
jgi:dipeptidyl aminopeptidase/acylaminoacyl peptidase